MRCTAGNINPLTIWANIFRYYTTTFVKVINLKRVALFHCYVLLSQEHYSLDNYINPNLLLLILQYIILIKWFTFLIYLIYILYNFTKKHSITDISYVTFFNINLWNVYVIISNSFLNISKCKTTNFSRLVSNWKMSSYRIHLLHYVGIFPSHFFPISHVYPIQFIKRSFLFSSFVNFHITRNLRVSNTILYIFHYLILNYTWQQFELFNL